MSDAAASQRLALPELVLKRHASLIFGLTDRAIEGKIARGLGAGEDQESEGEAMKMRRRAKRLKTAASKHPAMVWPEGSWFVDVPPMPLYDIGGPCGGFSSGLRSKLVRGSFIPLDDFVIRTKPATIPPVG